MLPLAGLSASGSRQRCTLDAAFELVVPGRDRERILWVHLRVCTLSYDYCVQSHLSYSAWDGQDLNTMKADFGRMRSQYKARYVRMYGWFDDDGTYLNNMISAAYSQGLGIYATIWFGEHL